jgi:hypothetical protein
MKICTALLIAMAVVTTAPVTVAADTLVLADAAAKVITPEIVRKINEAFACSASENPSIENRKAHLGGLSPGALVAGMLKYKYGIEVTGEVKAVITQQPVHGKIAMIGLATQSFPGLSFEEFEYTPDTDLLGADRVVFEVTANGQKFRISTVIKVVHGGFNDVCVPPDGGRGALSR